MLQATINARIGTSVNVTTPFGTTVDSEQFQFLQQIADGVGLGQAKQVFLSTRNLVATSETIDLYAFGGARDAVGAVFALSRIVALAITNKNLVAGQNLLIGGEGSAAAWVAPFNGVNTAKLSIEPGGTILLVAPSLAAWPVTSATVSHLLKIDAGANTIPYDIMVIGS